MLRKMSMRRFLAWCDYDAIEPIGQRRDDWHAASICAAVMNAAAITNGAKIRFKVSDFLLQFGQDPVSDVKATAAPATSWQSMKFIARMMVASSNADEKKVRHRKR